MSNEKMSNEEMAKRLAKLEKFEASHKKSQERRNARIKIILAKAEKAGIVVTDAEVDAFLAKK